MDKEDVVHIYNGIFLSHWKELNDVIYSSIDRPRESHTKWSNSDREGETLYDIPYMWNLKWNGTNQLTKQRETHRVREQTWFPRGKG